MDHKVNVGKVKHIDQFILVTFCFLRKLKVSGHGSLILFYTVISTIFQSILQLQFCKKRFLVYKN